MKRFSLLLPIAALAALAAERPADAGNCSDLTNPIYLQVGDTQVNLMRQLGRKLRDNTAKPITLVWITSGSCANIDLIYNHNPANGITAATMSYVPSTAEDPAFNPATGTLLTCTPPAAPFFPDIANSALYNDACTTITQTNTAIGKTNGPIQGYVLAVPEASNEHVITFEEAYFVFGFGATTTGGMIAPWTDPTQVFIRTATKSTLLAWSLQLGIPASKMKGNAFDGSPQVVSSLQTSTNPEAAIGVLGVEVYDPLRSSLNVLAYRAKGQYAAYYPDSTPTAFDKQNIRDGHYVVWSPTVWMQNLTGTTPTKADADYVIQMIAGHVVTPAPNFVITDVEAGVGIVPDCAMGVTRDFEQGPLRLYTPTTSCTCRYEYVTTGLSSCETCSATTPCATGVCRNNYCEAK